MWQQFDDFLHFLPQDARSDQEKFERFYQDLSRLAPTVRTDRLYLLSLQMESRPKLYAALPEKLKQEPELAKAVARGLTPAAATPDERATLIEMVCQHCPEICSHKKSFMAMAQNKIPFDSFFQNFSFRVLEDDPGLVMELCVVNGDLLRGMPSQYRNDSEFIRSWINRCKEAPKILVSSLSSRHDNEGTAALDPNFVLQHPGITMDCFAHYGNETALLFTSKAPSMPKELWQNKKVMKMYLENGGMLKTKEQEDIMKDDADLWLAHVGGVANTIRPPQLDKISEFDEIQLDSNFWKQAAKKNGLAARYVQDYCRATDWFLDVLLITATQHGVVYLEDNPDVYSLYEESTLPKLGLDLSGFEELLEESLSDDEAFKVVSSAMDDKEDGGDCLLPMIRNDLVKELIGEFVGLPSPERLEYIRLIRPKFPLVLWAIPVAEEEEGGYCLEDTAQEEQAHSRSARHLNAGMDEDEALRLAIERSMNMS